MAAYKILLPYNFTPWDRKALDFVIRTFSPHRDVEVALFNAFMPLPEVEAARSTVMEKIQSNLSYLNIRINEMEEALEAASRGLVQAGFAPERVRTVFNPRKKDVATEIVRQAEAQGSDIIVLSHSSGKVARFFTGSTYAQVVSSVKDATVCIVS